MKEESISELIKRKPIAIIDDETAHKAQQREIDERRQPKLVLLNRFADDNITIDKANYAFLNIYQDLLNERFEKEISPRAVDNVNVLVRWLFNSKKSGLMLYGGCGSGKTTLARVFARVIGMYNNGKRGSLRIAIRLFDAVNNSELINDKTLLQTLCTVQWLILDDLGAEEQAIVKDYGNSVNPFSEIIFARYERNLPTVITTNLSLQDVCTRYGTTDIMRERLADRLREQYNIVPICGASFRAENA